MLIDNFTVIAQLINFLILVWLLKRFLYKPVLRAIDAREQRLQQQQQQAEQQQQKAQTLKLQLEQEHAELQQQRDTLIEKARNEVKTQKDQELEQARTEIEAQKQRWNAQLQIEQQNLQGHLRDCALTQLRQGVSHALHDLAEVKLETQLLNHFSARLGQLPTTERQELCRINAAANVAPIIKTGFPLDDSMQNNLRAALDRVLEQHNVSFEQDPDIGCGIELRWEDYRLSWSIDTYLEQMEQKLRQQMDEINATKPLEAPVLQEISA
ncbi:MAG: F0F1 ATP synthase subunit delta [Desulfuromonadaceae bacterium]|nr:F0F1 ATP synthase subunit delta [Desulfuromonadaceae bacterium]